MSPCDHEEADTQIFVHIAEAQRHCYSKFLVRANDTDVVVLAVITAQKLNCTALLVGTKNNRQYIAAHEIAYSLGPMKVSSLATFHIFTGCDLSAYMNTIGKKTAWNIFI